MKIYVAGALSSKEKNNRTPTQVVVDYLQNVHKMCKIAGQLRKRGHAPFIPALDLVMGIICGNWNEEDYRGLGMEFLEVCDAVLAISYSWGVQKEIERARELGLPVYYTLEEIG